MVVETEVCDTCGKNVRVSVGLHCVVCKLYKHRKCEKVESGNTVENYTCKKCQRKKSMENEDSQQESSVIVEEVSDSESEGENDQDGGCGVCQQVVEENYKLKEENKSLKEVIALLKKDLEELRKIGGGQEQEVERSEWVEMRSKKKETVTRRRSNVMELRNRFEVLSEHSEGNGDVNMVSKKNGHGVQRSARKKKKRVLLLSSSQGRHCSRILGEKLSDEYEVCGVVRPNAKFKDVVESVEGLTKDFGKDDCVIVMAGGNDEEDSDFQDGFREGIRKIMSVKDRMNVIINALPPRYDKPVLEEKVKWMNRFLHSEINRQGERQNQNVRMNFGMERMDRKHFTRHGLLLNFYGKNAVCEKMFAFVKDFDNKGKCQRCGFLGH